MKKYLSSTKSLFLISSFLICVIFRSPLKDVFDSLLVLPILIKIEPSNITDISLCIVLIILFTRFISSLKSNTIVNNDWFLLGIFIFVSYTWCRVSEVYIYTWTFNIAGLAYSDFLLLPILGIWILKLKEFTKVGKTPPYHGMPFIGDQPSNIDLAKRENFSKKIAQRIQANVQLKGTGALAISISGIWGTGKTTFLKLIEQSIDKNNRIVIHFNPWRSSGSDKINEDFFELLISELKRFDPNLSKNIYAYAKSLTSIDDNMATRIARTFSVFFDNLNKNKIYDSINTSLKDIDKQILVFIDDLDRLDHNEILEVLKLIRNTANFNNMVYVVAFDKEYVQEAIKSFNSYNYKFFLEKIFQFEFQIPFYDPEIIRKFLKDKLTEVLIPQTSIIEESIDATIKDIIITDRILKTQRDAIRLLNTMLLEYEELSEELFFYDFYLLQLLKLKFSNVYKAIVDFRAVFFIRGDFGNSTVRFRFMNEAEKLKGAIAKIILQKNGAYQMPEEEPYHETIFENYINAQKRSGELTEEEGTFIIDILSELIDENRSFNRNYKDEARRIFAKEANLFKYFALDVPGNEISIGELEKYRKLEYTNYEVRIKTWIEEDKTRPLFQCLCGIQQFHTKEEFENQLKALFMVGSPLSGDLYSDGIDYNKIIGIATLSIQTINKIYESEEHYHNFLRSLFKYNIRTINFTANVIGQVLANKSNFPLKNDELAEDLLNVFKMYLDSEHPFKDAFWNIYHRCKSYPEGSYEAKAKAKDLASLAFKSKATVQDLALFIKRDYHNSHQFSLFDSVVELFMDSKSQLELWLEEAQSLEKSSDCYKEFLDFFKATKDADWKLVQYHFQFLKV